MKKVVFTILLCLSFLLTTSTLVLADATSMGPEENGAALRQYSESGKVTSPVHVFNIKDSDAYWVTCHGGGIGCSDKETDTLPYLNKSVLGMMNAGIAYLYLQKPVDTNQYAAYYGQRLGLVKPAYAQGIGFAGLSPLLGLWRAFSNIAYGFLSLILVAIGFMILFRMKIDPRTVISVQNALPRIIVTLLLIFFSYAIVGLLIDAMYLLIFLTISVLKASVPSIDLQATISQYSGGPLSHLFGAVFTSGKPAVTGIVNLVGGATFTNITTIITTVLGLVIGNAALGGVRGLVIGGGIGNWVGSSNALIWLIVILALLFAFFRILITLISAYIQILLSVIFGPLQIMFGAIPNSDAFGSWFRSLVANLAVFPITSLMLLIGSIISYYGGNTSQPLWTPPGLGGNVGAAASGIISLGMVLLIPSLANSVKELIKAKPALPVGAAIGQSLASPWQTGMQLLSTGYYIQSITAGMFKPKAPAGTPEAGGGH